MGQIIFQAIKMLLKINYYRKIHRLTKSCFKLIISAKYNLFSKK